MATLDPATEWRRLSEVYGQMDEGELLALARLKSELTDVAREALANEIRQRRLTVQPEAPPIVLRFPRRSRTLLTTMTGNWWKLPRYGVWRNRFNCNGCWIGLEFRL